MILDWYIRELHNYNKKVIGTECCDDLSNSALTGDWGDLGDFEGRVCYRLYTLLNPIMEK